MRPPRPKVSVAVTGEQIPGNGPLTLSFADGRLSAFAGCNRGSGLADLSGGHLTTRLATTMMACPLIGTGWRVDTLHSTPAGRYATANSVTSNDRSCACSTARSRPRSTAIA
ncbi:META domain-containing protein [Mycolicibacterium fluoranthenivorans]|nr:META domain-containing protein [Mycolicibacterium fluoranthenivorans]